MKKKTSRNKSNRQWIKAHIEDPYVKKAQKEGYRSRAAFKLIEIQEKDKIVKPGSWVIDLGAAPGGWSQLAAKWAGRNGKVIAVDCLPMDPVAGVTFVHGDFTDQSILDQLLAIIGDHKINLVMSDMAPNISGIRAVDQPRAMYLAELAFELAQNVLDKNGSFLTKIFTGAGNEQYIKELRKVFGKVVTRKPKASRPNSREVYLLATGYT